MTDLSFMGGDADRVAEWRVKWNKLIEQSVIVDLTINQWWPYVRLSTDLLAKLGVPTDTSEGKAAVRRVLHGGKVDLVPAKYYAPIRQKVDRMRRNLNSPGHSVEVMFGRMVPATAYDDWRDTHETLEREFYDCVDSLIANFDLAQSEMREDYERVFGIVYDRMNDRRSPMTVGEMQNREQFIEGAIESILSMTPSPEFISGRYNVTVEYGYTPMIDELAEREAKAAEQRAQSMLTTDALSRERADIVARMNSEVAAQVEQQRAKVEDGFAKAEAAFYKELSETLTGVGKRLSDPNAKLGGRGSMAIKRVIEDARRMNIFEDDELMRRIDALELQLDERDPKADQTAFRNALANAVNYMETQVTEIPQFRGVRLVETGDDVEDVDVVGRAVIDSDAIDDVDEEVVTTTRRRAVAVD